MAVFSHGITEQDIIAQYPSQGALDITETSRGLSYGDLRAWRDQGAGVLNAIMSRHGIDPESLGEDEAMTVRAGIIAYVIGSALRRSGRLDMSREYMTEWSECKRVLRDTPQDLGASQSATSQVITSVPEEGTVEAAADGRDRWSSRWTGW